MKLTLVFPVNVAGALSKVCPDAADKDNVVMVLVLANVRTLPSKGVSGIVIIKDASVPAGLRTKAVMPVPMVMDVPVVGTR